MISISLVRGQHECTKGPTQPPDTIHWIWYKKTDSRTVSLVHLKRKCEFSIFRLYNQGVQKEGGTNIREVE